MANPALYTFGGDPTLSLADFTRTFFTSDGIYYSPDSFGSGSRGGRYEHTNLGIALLGYIIGNITGLTGIAEHGQQCPSGQ